MNRKALLAALLIGVVGSAEAADLTIGMGATVTSIDPHFYNASPNNSIAMQIFDRLTERTAGGQLEPGLAESWEATGDAEWTFHLRQGVTWHDGEPFTAEDVVFTLGRAGDVPNSPGGFGGFLRGITNVVAADDYTVVISTDGPLPDLPGSLVNIAIVSQHLGQGASTTDYNNGSVAVGTGAFEFVSFRNGDAVVLKKNEDWWGHEVDWDNVTYRMMTSDGGRTAAILSGDVDIIDTPAAADLPRLSSTPGIHVETVSGLRVIYLAPNVRDISEFAGVAGPNGEALDENPLQNADVRRALSLAINRQGIVERILEGTAAASIQWLPEGAYSYTPSLPVFEADAEAARQLLADAGYPNGFRLTLHAPNDRYPNSPEVAQAVAQMWSRIGVATSVEILPWSTYSGSRNTFAMHLVGLGNATFDASSMLLNVLGTRDAETGLGASNMTGYGNAELDSLTLQAMGIIDENQREAALIEAVEFAIGDQAIVPLYQQSNSWALRDGLTYEPRIDERTLAKDVFAN